MSEGDEERMCGCAEVLDIRWGELDVVGGDEWIHRARLRRTTPVLVTRLLQRDQRELFNDNDKVVDVCKHARQHAESLRKAPHPHLLRVLGIIREPPAVVWDAVPTPLVDIVVARSAGMSLLQKYRIALQTARALHHLHACGLVHGCVTSDHIFVTKDCAIAQVMDGFVGVNAAVEGTGKIPKPAELSSDVVQFGRVLYELFEERVATDWAKHQVRLFDLMPYEYREIVASCLADSPEGRPSMYSILRFLEDHPVWPSAPPAALPSSDGVQSCEDLLVMAEDAMTREEMRAAQQLYKQAISKDRSNPFAVSGLRMVERMCPELVVGIFERDASESLADRAIELTKDFGGDSGANLMQRANSGSGMAAMLAAASLINGIGFKTQDMTEAVRLCGVAAQCGITYASLCLGWCLEMGLGVEKDSAKAFKFYEYAANRGLAIAVFNLSVCYVNGIGVDADFDKAVDLIRQAARLGFWYANGRLGVLLESGSYVEQDLAQAAQQHRIAAEKGSPASQRALGFLYLEGLGVPENLREATRWLHLAAKQKDGRAKMQLDALTRLAAL